MKVIDSAPGHRALVFEAGETLDSEYLTLCLAASGVPIMDAYRDISEIFNVLDEPLEIRKQAEAFR
jgi:hypothetical protein